MGSSLRRRESSAAIEHSPEISRDQVEFKVDQIAVVGRPEIRL